VHELKAGKDRVHVDVVAEETVDDEVIRLEDSAPHFATGSRKKGTSAP